MSWWKVKRPMTISYGATSHVGLVRSENQDAYGSFPANNPESASERLFIVADGMGGHLGGKEASRIALLEVPKVFFNNKKATVEERLREAFSQANNCIYDKAQTGNGFDRMGTTCTALALTNGQISIAHVGDTRAYLIEKNKIDQLTDDHTLVEEMRREGVLTEAEARVHPRRNTLTRAMGVEPNLEIDVYDIGEIKPDQRFLLCSDGLSEVSSEEFQRIVMHMAPQEATDKLVAIANERGGHDNATALILRAV